MVSQLDLPRPGKVALPYLALALVGAVNFLWGLGRKVWLNRITADAYLGRMQTLFAQEFKEGKVPPLPQRAS